MERFKLGAFITNLGKFNEGEIVGEWINFPIKQEEFQAVLKRIGIDENYEEWFFSDFDTNLRGVSVMLNDYQNVDELNYLVALANELDSYDYEKFYGIVEDDMDLPENGIPGLINLTFNLEKYELYSNIFDRSLQQEVDGTIQGVYPFTDPVGIVCNDDGKWLGLPLNRALRDDEGKIYDIVAGTFLVVGLGEEDYCSMDMEMLDKYSKLFKNPEMYVQVAGEIKALPVPDRTITFDMMKEYGHESMGIAPLREKMAHKLFDAGFTVYNLIPAGTAERTASHQDIMEHSEKGGIFAIEKGAWMVFVENNPLAKVEELLEDDYGMIDGIINNGDKAKEDTKDRKTSVMEKLQEKKMESSKMEKTAPKQQKSKEMEIE